MQFITRTIEKWPRPVTTDRRRSGYKCSYENCLYDLEKELGHLQAKGDVILQLDLRQDDIRRDGLPYADSKIRSPRVAIFFTCRHGPLTYYADAFHTWQENVRAICLGLQRLRLVEETGIISRGEQYTGFKQLPSGIPMGPPKMTVEEAVMALVDMCPNMPTGWGRDSAKRAMHQDQMLFGNVWRENVRKHHPDAGGNRTQWDCLQAAAAVLEEHFKK